MTGNSKKAQPVRGSVTQEIYRNTLYAHLYVYAIIIQFVNLFRFVSLSQIAMELEVSADSDQTELLRLLTADWNWALVFNLQPRDLRMSRS